MKRPGNKPKPGRAGQTAPTAADSLASLVSPVLQQRLLDVFRDALWTGPTDVAALQEVKRHLYNRDFAAAFGREEYLRAYALRWSAGRALGYAQVFCDVGGHFKSSEGRSGGETGSLELLCIGGGAGAELVGLAGWTAVRGGREGWDGSTAGALGRRVRARFVDVADWTGVIGTLSRGVSTPPVLSKYASASARERNAAVAGEDVLETVFTQADVLGMDEAQLSDVAGQADLVTIMFTLNELYSSSVAKTQRLMNGLTAALRPGAVLLVVDSPGSYSTVSLNGAEKKYPMHWLLDHALLGPPDRRSEKADWDKLVSDESRWFRLPEGLEYPVELENMRYQMHVYRRRVKDEAG